jgi:phage-related protein
MAQTLDTSVYKTTRSISSKKQMKIKAANFGDGYKQQIFDSINYEREEWVMDFVPQDTTSAIALEALLLNSTNGTSNYLSWTPPGESETKYWTTTSVNKTHISRGFWRVSCTLTREFPLS